MDASPDDDAFITNYVGTLSGISQMFSRFLYGFLLDRVPVQWLIGFQSILLATDIGLLYTVSNLGRVPYVLALHVVYFTFPGIYSILPGITVRITSLGP